MKEKACQRGNECPHFKIADLIDELARNGASIPTREQLREYRRKTIKLGELVKLFEAEVINGFNTTGKYPCSDPMQIAWGRRAHQVLIKKFRKPKKAPSHQASGKGTDDSKH